jgi:hypothetical protein
VGTAQEMQTFQTAFLEVMKARPQSAELLHQFMPQLAHRDGIPT